MDPSGDAPSGRGDTPSAHEAGEASGSRSVDGTPDTLTTPQMSKVSDRARLALEASPYSERQIRRRESRARVKAHAGTQPRGVGLGTEPSTSKAPVVGPDDTSRETEERVAAADRDATPRAPGRATSTPKPSPRVARQSPEAHARRLKAAADELLRTPLPRVESVSPVGGFDVGSDVSHVSPSPPRRARFGDSTPASTPAGRAAMALIRSRASAAWQTPGTDWGDRARDEDAGAFGGTPVGRAAAARDRLRKRREAMAERFAAAERAYGASIRASSSAEARGKTKRARTNERRGDRRARGRETDAERTDADVAADVDADVPAETPTTPATPATPAWSTSYGGGSASARRTARLAAMTPHRAPREFREFRAPREKNAAPAPGPGPGPGPAAPVPGMRRRVLRTPATHDASTTHRVVREPPSGSKDEALSALRETMARRKRQRRARREATLKERAKLAAKASATAASPRTPAAARLSDLSFERARLAYGTDPKPRPAPVPVTARPLVAVRKSPEPPVLPTSSEKKRQRECRVVVAATAAASPYSASPRVALRRKRFVPASSPTDALPTLVAFRPRPPDRSPAEPGGDPGGIVVLPRRPRRPFAEQREREKEKASAAALERTARRLREAAARRARVREARREKARTLTPGKPKRSDGFPDDRFSSPFPRLGSHALGSPLPAWAEARTRPERVASTSPFAPAAGATSRRRDRASRPARDAVDDVVDRLVLDVVSDAQRDDAKTARAERRRVWAKRREAEIYARDLAKNAAEARRLARHAEKRAAVFAKPSRTRPSPSQPPRPRLSRVDGVVRARVDASARREMAAKRRERRRLIEARRGADVAKLALARRSNETTTPDAETPVSSRPTRLPPIAKPKTPFELELARFPRGVSAFDWEVEALPLGAAAASARAASAFKGVSALKSVKKKRRSGKTSTRDASALRARRGEVEAEIKRRAEKENRQNDAYDGDTVRASIDPEALAAADDALRFVEAEAFATLASFAEMDEAVDELIEREAHIEAVDARAARGVAAKEARARALEAARAEAKAKAAREAALAEALRASAEEARAQRQSFAGRVAAYIIDTVLVNETVRLAEELHLARRIAALRAQHEALCKRLEWRDKLEHTPRAVLRRVAYTAEEESIIRAIEPALAIRTVKDARYDPFANGPDLSWALTDEERAEKEARAKAEKEAAETLAEALAAEASGLASAPSALHANRRGAFAWEPAPIVLGAAAASRRAAAAYGGVSQDKEQRRKRRSRARERIVAALVRDAMTRLVEKHSTPPFFSRSEKSASAEEELRAATPDAINLELDFESDAKPASFANLRVVPDATATDATAETTSSGSETEAFVEARRRKRAPVAKPAEPRTAFEKPKAGARPPSPVSPLTPSGVVISPLSVSLRGVRKSLA